MANYSQNIGKHSELLATTALLANGYEVAQPIVPEAYDLVARCPQTGLWRTFQVKTCHYRKDRDAVVVFAKKGDGKPYTKQEADYIVGVLNSDVFLIENRECGEYWATPTGIEERWKKIDTNIKRNVG